MGSVGRALDWIKGLLVQDLPRLKSIGAWVKVFMIILEFRILRLSIGSRPQNAELGR